MEKVYVFLADGLEEIEGLTVVDILRRGDVETVTVSIGETKRVLGSHQIPIEADVLFSETDFSDAAMLVLPGGMPGTLHLGEHAGLTALLKDAAEKNVKIAAICAAPSVLGDLGLLSGKEATSYPGFGDRLTGAKYLEKEVVVSGNFTTSRGMGTAIAFSLELLAQLKGRERADEIGKGIIYRA